MIFSANLAGVRKELKELTFVGWRDEERCERGSPYRGVARGEQTFVGWRMSLLPPRPSKVNIARGKRTVVVL